MISPWKYQVPFEKLIFLLDILQDSVDDKYTLNQVTCKRMKKRGENPYR
jgi:hypothetical protein